MQHYPALGKTFPGEQEHAVSLHTIQGSLVYNVCGISVAVHTSSSLSLNPVKQMITPSMVQE